MLLRQLEYLVALARERYFARAAAACYVSQPSLSAAIRKLEHELDVPIVRRGRRFEGLTPEGERVLPWAHRILAERDALRHELSAMRGGLAGTREILEDFFAGEPQRDEYLIVDGGALAGVGAHSYSVKK